MKRKPNGFDRLMREEIAVSKDKKLKAYGNRVVDSDTSLAAVVIKEGERRGNNSNPVTG